MADQSRGLWLKALRGDGRQVVVVDAVGSYEWYAADLVAFGGYRDGRSVSVLMRLV